MNPELLVEQKPLSERGQKILTAAQALFLEHGYDNTSLDMIIRESGGSRRNIYSEFGNKEGLLLAVVREHVSTQLNTLLDIDYQLSPQEALSQVSFRFMKGFLSETLIGLFRLVTNIVPSFPEVGQLIFQAGPLTGCKPISNYLEYLAEQGELDIDDAQFAAHMLIEMVKSRLHLQAILVPSNPPSDAQIKQHIEKAVKVFLRAYKV